MDQFVRQAGAWWQSLGPDGHYYVWLASGVLMLSAIAVGGYYLLRYLLGHRKFRGTWYSETQLAELVQVTWEDQNSGHRVLRGDEVALLRKWRGMGRGLGFDGRNSYF